MDTNLRININDLYLNRDTSFLQEVTPWETKNIQGGFRRRRNSNPGTTENSDISGLLENVNTSLGNLRVEVDKLLEDLRQAIIY